MIIDAIEQVGGIYVITADHGNAEDMVKRDKSGKPLLDKSGNLQILTSHTLEPVSNIAFYFLHWRTRSMVLASYSPFSWIDKSQHIFSTV